MAALLSQYGRRLHWLHLLQCPLIPPFPSDSAFHWRWGMKANVSQIYGGLWALELGSCVWILTLPTWHWGKLQPLYIPWFSCWQNEDTNGSCITEIWWWWSELTQGLNTRLGIQQAPDTVHIIIASIYIVAHEKCIINSLAIKCILTNSLPHNWRSLALRLGSRAHPWPDSHQLYLIWGLPFQLHFIKQCSQVVLRKAPQWWDCQNTSVQGSQSSIRSILLLWWTVCIDHFFFGWATDKRTGLHLEARFDEKCLLLNGNSTPCSKRRGMWVQDLPGEGQIHLLSHIYSEAMST